MHPHAQLIETFYTAFKNSDPAAMIACYHPDIEFSDPVFPGLRGNRAKAMWAMLGQNKADLLIISLLHPHSPTRENGGQAIRSNYRILKNPILAASLGLCVACKRPRSIPQQQQTGDARA